MKKLKYYFTFSYLKPSYYWPIRILIILYFLIIYAGLVYDLLNPKIELEKSKILQRNNLRPYITYAHLPDLLEMLIGKNEKINFVDIGAGNLNLYYYLRKKFENLNYFFKDQHQVEEFVKNFIKVEKLDKISEGTVENLNLVNIASN